MTKEIFTIGYSTFSVDGFIETLNSNNITAIADVRSSPYSRFRPEFNRENLKQILLRNNIAYVFLGEECGARINAPECYINGKADYHLIANHPKFQEGLRRIREGLKRYRIALMCAEKDPITCHRTILICRQLRSKDIRIQHIMANDSVEDHAESEKRLMRLFKLDHPNLFITEATSLEDAYDRQGRKIAYQKVESYQDEQMIGVA
ncbi:MAG: DUF488 family protein [Desulfobacteria bacterium]